MSTNKTYMVGNTHFDPVFRLVETKGIGCMAQLTAGNKQWQIELLPYEIKTVKLQEEKLVTVNILEE